MMSLFSKRNRSSKGSNSRLVVTGKRVNGTWIMESSLPATSKRNKKTGAIMRTDNNRVRTLH